MFTKLFIQQLSFLVQSNVPFRRITVTHNTPSYITPLIKSLLQEISSCIEGKVKRLESFPLKLAIWWQSTEEELKTQITKTLKSSGARSEQPCEPIAEPQL